MIEKVYLPDEGGLNVPDQATSESVQPSGSSMSVAPAVPGSRSGRGSFDPFDFVRFGRSTGGLLWTSSRSGPTSSCWVMVAAATGSTVVMASRSPVVRPTVMVSPWPTPETGVR